MSISKISIEKYNVTASDTMPPLPVDCVDITGLDRNKIISVLDSNNVRKLLRKCKCYLYSVLPIKIHYSFTHKRIAVSAVIQKFDSLNDVEVYLRRVTPLVHSIIENKIHGTWAVRVFSYKGEVFSYKWYDMVYDRASAMVSRYIYAFKRVFTSAK